ncbi:hypothetical protein GRS48_07405 [Halorubrum sp. JWXQ-INN 858]|nr:hypothetical protein [Halorubrum sp. JWXQ-INN 858]MWV64647.1 hypothetical protein [Halorubrum sp. JWXQ-INN 858]
MDVDDWLPNMAAVVHVSTGYDRWQRGPRWNREHGETDRRRDRRRRWFDA